MHTCVADAASEAGRVEVRTASREGLDAAFARLNAPIE
jgi:hypothetical protein